MILSNDRIAVITHDFIPGHTYEVVVRAIGPDGTQQPIEGAVRNTITIEGKTAAPTSPSGLMATGYLNAVTLEWTNPSNYDVAFVEVWRSATNTISSAAKLAEVRGTTYIDAIGSSGVTRYYWVRTINSSAIASPYFPNTTVGVVGTSDGVEATDIADFAVTATKMFNKTIILTGDAWTNNSPGGGSIAWNAHSVVYNGAAYPVDAGNTSQAYVYWGVGDSTYSTSATQPVLVSAEFMIAINKSGIHTLVWNSSANMVIGTAFIANLAVTDAKIANATITNAKIATVDAGKITTGILVVARTEAKATDPLADQTGANTAASIAGQGSLATLSVVEDAQLGTTVIDGGLIITSLLSADNIITGKLQSADGFTYFDLDNNTLVIASGAGS